jgi:hypothetical protein
MAAGQNLRPFAAATRVQIQHGTPLRLFKKAYCILNETWLNDYLCMYIVGFTSPGGEIHVEAKRYQKREKEKAAENAQREA